VVFVTLNAWRVHDIFATDAHARQLGATNTRTQTQLRDAQADSTALNATIIRARAELAKLTAANDALNRDASTTRAAAKQTSGELKSVLAKIQEQHGAAGPLATCVTRLQGALNALSGGDTAAAQWTLATVDDACKNAGQ
jgi:septal ring factor EnvC (AmiA/AmiB activator)